MIRHLFSHSKYPKHFRVNLDKDSTVLLCLILINCHVAAPSVMHSDNIFKVQRNNTRVK